MEYNFLKVNETFPKCTSRSKRSLKKLHLYEFADTLIYIDFPVATYGNDNEDVLLDIIHEHDNSCFVFASANNTNIMFDVKTSEFTEEMVKEYCHGLLLRLSEVEPNFAQIEKITINYGDAYYGEW